MVAHGCRAPPHVLDKSELCPGIWADTQAAEEDRPIPDLDKGDVVKGRLPLRMPKAVHLKESLQKSGALNMDAKNGMSHRRTPQKGPPQLMKTFKPHVGDLWGFELVDRVVELRVHYS